MTNQATPAPLAAPEGQWVPKKLPQQMVDAWASAPIPPIDGLDDDEANRIVAQANWDAMLAAAPAASPSTPEMAKELAENLRWALLRIRTSLDMGDHYEQAEACLARYDAAPAQPGQKPVLWIGPETLRTLEVARNLGNHSLSDMTLVIQEPRADLGFIALRAAAPGAAVPTVTDRIEGDRRGLQMVLAGLLFDFGGFLTTRDERITCSSADNAGPMVDAIKKFAAVRGLNLDDAAVLSWQEVSASIPAPASPAAQPAEANKLLDFGDYVDIEQKRFGAPNEFYRHKVIGRIRSNAWIDVPAQTHLGATLHDHDEEVLLVICCGVKEEKVERYRASDTRFGATVSAEGTPASHEPNGKASSAAPSQPVAAQAQGAMTEIDIADDDALRFVQRVFESEAPYEDRKKARDMVVAIRTRALKTRAALRASSAPDQSTDRAAMTSNTAGGVGAGVTVGVGLDRGGER